MEDNHLKRKTLELGDKINERRKLFTGIRETMRREMVC
jgi:hypothetical protein